MKTASLFPFSRSALLIVRSNFDRIHELFMHFVRDCYSLFMRYSLSPLCRFLVFFFCYSQSVHALFPYGMAIYGPIHPPHTKEQAARHVHVINDAYQDPDEFCQYNWLKQFEPDKTPANQLYITWLVQATNANIVQQVNPTTGMIEDTVDEIEFCCGDMRWQAKLLLTHFLKQVRAIVNKHPKDAQSYCWFRLRCLPGQRAEYYRVEEGDWLYSMSTPSTRGKYRCVPKEPFVGQSSSHGKLQAKAKSMTPVGKAQTHQVHEEHVEEAKTYSVVYSWLNEWQSHT